MDVVKKNLFYLICGVAAVAGIGLAVFGIQSMTEVRTRMSEAGSLLSQIGSVSRGTVNRTAIEAAEARVKAIRTNFTEVVEWANNQNRRPPLVAGIFPGTPGPKKLEFRDAYVAELDRLQKLLKAGEPPTNRDISVMAEKIKNERPQGGGPAEAPKPGTATQPASGENRAGVPTDEDARTKAAVRAALVKAQEISCYASPDTLQRVTAMETGGIELAAEVLWDAQRTLWVQQDVVEALARLNEAAARRLKEERLQAWVGVLPIKDVVSIRISEYVFKESEGTALARPGGPDPAKPPGTAAESFTGYMGTDLYDVFQFTVKLVVDPRQIPAIINEICKGRFYTPLRVAYEAVPPNTTMTDKIYGEDPVVSVVMDFEAYQFGDIYRRLMPDAILKEIGRERPGEEGKPRD